LSFIKSLHPELAQALVRSFEDLERPRVVEDLHKYRLQDTKPYLIYMKSRASVTVHLPLLQLIADWSILSLHYRSGV
jgi:hypothetical protein